MISVIDLNRPIQNVPFAFAFIVILSLLLKLFFFEIHRRVCDKSRRRMSAHNARTLSVL